MTIKYFNKDYPNDKINTISINNYYCINYDLVVNNDKINLTNDEKEGNFRVEKINKNIIIEKLTNSLISSTRKGVVEDTIEVLKEYVNK